MGLIDFVKSKFGDYLLSVGAKRMAAAVVGSAVAFLTSAAFQDKIGTVGLTMHLDPEQLNKAILGGITAGVVGLHDFLRLKFPNLHI